MENLAYTDDETQKQRIETIDGVIVMMSPRPRPEHTVISGRIFAEFDRYLRKKQCKAYPNGVDLFLDEKNHFIPDAMIVCDRNKITKRGVVGAPDLAVEVLSQTTAMYDRTKKKDIYEKAGVKEYWIVDGWGNFIEVYILTNGKFELNNIYYYLPAEEKAQLPSLPEKEQAQINKSAYGKIKVSLYDDLYIDLDDIFEDV